MQQSSQGDGKNSKLDNIGVFKLSNALA